MALKQLHLNDDKKTPIVPVISNESIPTGAITRDKLEKTIQDDIKGSVKSYVTQTVGNTATNITSNGDYLLFNSTELSGDYTNTSLKIDTNSMTFLANISSNTLKKFSVNQQGVYVDDNEIAIKNDLTPISNNASSALSKATTAESNASSALSKATTAESNASSALSKATTAESNASSASSLASEAKKSADSAGTKANELGAIVSALRTKVDKINTDLMVVVSDVSTAQATAEASASQAQSAYNLANDKQDKLVSGDNIKTINGVSLLGNGNVNVTGENGKALYKHIIKVASLNYTLVSLTSTPYKNTNEIFNDNSVLGLINGMGLINGQYFYNNDTYESSYVFPIFDPYTNTFTTKEIIYNQKVESDEVTLL